MYTHSEIIDLIADHEAGMPFQWQDKYGWHNFEPDFPIPALFPRDVKDEDLYKNEAALRKACLGHWYPSPADPAAAIAADRKAFKGLTRVVELKAGTRYVLPVDLAEFKGRGETP